MDSSTICSRKVFQYCKQPGSFVRSAEVLNQYPILVDQDILFQRLDRTIEEVEFLAVVVFGRGESTSTMTVGLVIKSVRF